MLRNCPKLAFVDVETTGGSPTSDRITEIAIVLVCWPANLAGPPHIQRWSSLVNPQMPIPTEISYLTGIDNAMVADAPRFEALAPRILALLEDAVFVAHHARFDYGFVKAALAHCGHTLTAPTLCTVRLSRLLHPDRSPHTLDALIIRHKLPCADRHRAMGDAAVLWHFLIRMFRDHGIDAVSDAALRLLKKPNLPAHLGIETVEQIPARPGIYFLHGLNAHPLYIGKSRNIRQRIASHFCGDHTSERGIRLASETRRISWHETPGEFSALLAEIQAIDQQMPAHNRALRRNRQSVAFRFDGPEPKPCYLKLTGDAPAVKRAGTMAICDNPGAGDLYGPFSSRAAARASLQQLATAHHWCQNRLGLVRATDGSPCFARQLGRCTGACIGAITDAELMSHMLPEVEPLRIPAWPGARLLVVESGYGHTAWHLFDRWCWLASGQGTPDDAPTGSPNPPRFDRHIYRLLRTHFTNMLAADNQRWHHASAARLHSSHQLSARWLAAAPALALSDPRAEPVGTANQVTG